jgi:hypothetical protein
VSNLEDSRVLSAFSTQQSALPYMINVEQRIGALKSQILTAAKASDVAALQSQVAALQASDTAQDAVINSLSSSYGNTQRLLTKIDPWQSITSTAFTLVSGTGGNDFDLTITVSKASSEILVMFVIPDVYLSGAGYLRFAIREGSGSYRQVGRVLNMSGRSIPVSGFIVYPVGIGNHQFRLYANVDSGTSADLWTGTTATENISASFLVSQIK